MRLFISEFVCGGEWPGVHLDGSLATEGRAMLCGLLQDAIRIAGLDVATIWDPRLGQLQFPGVRIAEAGSQIEAHELFEETVAWSDATILIAPEFDGLLTQQALLVEGIGSRLCGPNPASIAQCTDKLLLSEILDEANVPNVPSYEFWVGHTKSNQIRFPAVVKPRDGAGSQETYLVRDAYDFSRLEPVWINSSLLRQAIWQPFVEGQAVSVGVLVSPEQYRFEPLPVCEQILSDDGRFKYRGGILPARDVQTSTLQAAAVAACRAVPGLRGYVGVDLLVPDRDPLRPLVVEINPRLTTSYLGYARQCEQNLLERWLNPEVKPPALQWRSGRIQFSPFGEFTELDG